MNRHKILVVDDDLMARKLLIQQLLLLGQPNVAAAEHGAAGFAQLTDALAAEDPFDIVLLDWHMPIMDGLQFLRKFRGDQGFNQAAVIMLTAESEPRNIQLAMDTGATAYIVKPLTREALSEKITYAGDWLDQVRASG